MKITCHACDAKYTIADEKVTGRTVKIKCKKCGATIVVNADPAAAGGAPMSTGAPAYAEPQPAAGGEDDGLMATRVFGGDTGGASVTTTEWTVSLTGEDERQMSQLQIAEEIQRGAITADTYVWRDGMTDWLPVAQIGELAGLLSRAAPAAPAYAPSPVAAVEDEPGMGLAGTMIMTDNSAPSPFAPPRPAAGGSPFAPPPALAPTPAAAAPALAAVNQPTAARRANRNSGGVDVFAAAAETRDAGGPPRPPTPAARLGERNENSVLFSLSALTATENAAAKSSGKNDDAVLDMGFGRSNGRSAVDDLMNMGGGAIGGPMLAPPPLLAPVVEPPPAPVPVAVHSAAPIAMPSDMAGPYGQGAPKKSKTGLIIGIAAAVVVLGGVGIFFAVSGGDPAAAGSGSATSAPTTTQAAATPTVTTPAGNTGAPAVTDTPAASGAPAASSAAVASNDTGGKTPSSGTGGGPAPSGKASAAPSTSASTKPTAEPAATATAAPTADPGGGSRDFNKGAATTALSGAAGAAKGCKQAGGPTGSASVRVVFAPSGNVTSANVQGPPFAGTPVGGCIASAFRGARVPAFDGSPVAVTKTVNIN